MLNTLPKHPISLDTIFLKEYSIQRKIPLHTPAALVEPNFEIKTDFAMIAENKIRAYFSFYTIPTEKIKENLIIDFRLVYETIFTINGPLLPEKDVQSFLASSGLILIWPYFRQTLTDFTVRLGLPPLILPLLNVEKTIEELHKKYVDETTKI